MTSIITRLPADALNIVCDFLGPYYLEYFCLDVFSPSAKLLRHFQISVKDLSYRLKIDYINEYFFDKFADLIECMLKQINREFNNVVWLEIYFVQNNGHFAEQTTEFEHVEEVDLTDAYLDLVRVLYGYSQHMCVPIQQSKTPLPTSNVSIYPFHNSTSVITSLLDNQKMIVKFPEGVLVTFEDKLMGVDFVTFYISATCLLHATYVAGTLESMGCEIGFFEAFENTHTTNGEEVYMSAQGEQLRYGLLKMVEVTDKCNYSSNTTIPLNSFYFDAIDTWVGTIGEDFVVQIQSGTVFKIACSEVTLLVHLLTFVVHNAMEFLASMFEVQFILFVSMQDVAFDGFQISTTYLVEGYIDFQLDYTAIQIFLKDILSVVGKVVPTQNVSDNIVWADIVFEDCFSCQVGVNNNKLLLRFSKTCVWQFDYLEDLFLYLSREAEREMIVLDEQFEETLLEAIVRISLKNCGVPRYSISR